MALLLVRWSFARLLRSLSPRRRRRRRVSRFGLKIVVASMRRHAHEPRKNVAALALAAVLPFYAIERRTK